MPNMSPSRPRQRWFDKARAIAKTKGITYKDFANALHITESAVGHYLKGRREPSIEQIRIISRILEVSMSELLGEDLYFLIDENERKIIDWYRKLSSDKQAAAKIILDAMSKELEHLKDQ